MRIAQLVERCLAKAKVAGSSPVSHSIYFKKASEIMKSFIYEAKTVEEAIRKAWENAGAPQIFTIKVLEQGNNSFFWWKNKNTKIMFSYEINTNENIKNMQQQQVQLENKNLQYRGYFEEKSADKTRRYKNNNNTQPQQKGNFNKTPNKIYKKETNSENLEKPENQNKNFNKAPSPQLQKRNERTDSFNKNSNFQTQNREKIVRPGFSLDQSYFIKKWTDYLYQSFFYTNKRPIVDFFDSNKSCKIFFHNDSTKIEKEKLLSLSLSIKYILLETLKIRYNKQFDSSDCKIIVYFDNPQENEHKK